MIWHFFNCNHFFSVTIPSLQQNYALKAVKDNERIISQSVRSTASCLVTDHSFPSSEWLILFLNTRQVQSNLSDVALTKTCDESGCHATPICLPFCTVKCRMENSDKYIYAVFLSDLVMFIKTIADNSLPYLLRSVNLAFMHSCHLLMLSHRYSRTGPVYCLCYSW